MNNEDESLYTTDYDTWSGIVAKSLSMYGPRTIDLSPLVQSKKSYSLAPVSIHNGKVLVMKTKTFESKEEALTYIDTQDVIYAFVFTQLLEEQPKYLIRSAKHD